MDQPSLQLLLKRYLDQTITEEELLALQYMLLEAEEKEKVLSSLEGLLTEQAPDMNYRAEDWEGVLQKIKGAAPTPVVDLPQTKRTSIAWIRWVAAAIVIGLMAWGVWIITHAEKVEDAPIAVGPALQDIAPGREGAVLTLADGSQMILDSLGNGVISSPDGSTVVLKNGQLSYAGINDTSLNTPIAYHAISTPNGRQFSLFLPDGTRVWLNAASSIRYPTRFKGGERRVEIRGEAYFEVAKNARMPFLVRVQGGSEIKVLGTHFNVNAYAEGEQVKTTLLEGSVKVKATGTTAPWVLLRPGQQAQVKKEIRIVTDIALDKVMAWKNGLFDFNGARLEEVMGQLARWYDLEVVYERGIPDVEFGGKMSRNVPLSDVLEGLKGMNIHFRLEEGRRLVVMP
jgi:transmembrane sensor